MTKQDLFAALITANVEAGEAVAKSLNNIFDADLRKAADEAQRKYAEAMASYRKA